MADPSPDLNLKEAKDAKICKPAKHVLKSLKHNGIYVPPYDYKGFTIKIQTTPIKLAPKSEQMAVAWIRKRQSEVSPPDKVFMKNFMIEFLEQLKKENPALGFL
jgi:hypothetical protein